MSDKATHAAVTELVDKFLLWDRKHPMPSLDAARNALLELLAEREREVRRETLEELKWIAKLPPNGCHTQLNMALAAKEQP